MKTKNGQEFSVLIRSGRVNIDEIQENILYYYKETRKIWMLCPCGCETIITIPTAIAEKGIFWMIDGIHGGPVSFHPAVINQPCGAHFIISQGKLVWL